MFTASYGYAFNSKSNLIRMGAIQPWQVQNLLTKEFERGVAAPAQRALGMKDLAIAP